MAKKKQKEKNNTGRRRSGVAATVALSLLLLVVLFCVLLFLLGYVCYVREIGYANLWLLYLAASALMSSDITTILLLRSLEDSMAISPEWRSTCFFLSVRPSFGRNPQV